MTEGQPIMMGNLLDRRAFGRATAAATAAAIVGTLGAGVAAAAGTQRTVVYRLAASWDAPAGRHGRTECGCRACRSHAENKIFFTRTAADSHRAHPGCHCTIEAVTVAGSLADLRRSSRDGVSLDRRHSPKQSKQSLA